MRVQGQCHQNGLYNHFGAEAVLDGLDCNCKPGDENSLANTALLEEAEGFHSRGEFFSPNILRQFCLAALNRLF